MTYYESKTYGKVCEMAFGLDLKQFGMMTKAQLDLLMEKCAFNESQTVLEIGCGAGQIAAYINSRTSAKFVCVDVDEKVISWASETYKGNDGLEFLVVDVGNISEINRKFNRILAIDSLYFLNNMKAEGFIEALRKTVRDLYELLDDSGKLAVFWSELPFFKPERKAPECTQLGICLKELGYEYEVFDFTESEINFWKSLKAALLLHEQDFMEEGSKELFDSEISETDFLLEGAEKGRLYRNLYIIKKNGR